MISAAEVANYLATAADILDEISPFFLQNLGSHASVTKGVNDFATEADLELERLITTKLTERTGLPSHGEEFGGVQLNSGLVWVVDPIDGTANYAAALPICGILVALLEDSVPIAGLTWLPAWNSKGLKLIGAKQLGISGNSEPISPLVSATLSASTIAFGAFDISRGGLFSGKFRHQVLGELSQSAARIRSFGSAGVDLALVATGAIGGVISFGNKAWDYAAGAALVTAAGGIVTDAEGVSWRAGSSSLVAAAPGIHDELMKLIRKVKQ